MTDLLAVISAWGACPGYSCDPGAGYDPDDCEGECGHLFGQEYIDCLEECWELNNP